MDSSRFLRSIIRLFLTAIFLGICLMWVITPTNAYTPVWKAFFSNKILSTYFGIQATSLFIWTLPVLLFAVLGSLYLHLGKNLNQNDSKSSNGKKDWLDLWKKRPMLVKGPLGIVSAIELAFFTMFIALLVWTLGLYLHKLQTVTPQEAEMHRLTVRQYRFAFVAWYISLVGDICLAFLFYPVARGSSVLPLFGLTSEGSIKYHIWIGHITMVLFTAHGIGFVVFWAGTGRIEKMLEWGYARISNLAGEISLLGGLGLWAACIPRIRRKFFELFFYTHHLYIIFMLFYILHVGISCTLMVIPGFYLFLVDRYIRFLQSRTSVRLLSARVLPNAFELNFAKSHGLTYNPASIMFVNVPSISRLQWHPFTISSNSNLETDKISVLIKCEGSWSTKLYDVLSSSIERLDVSLEGPYGPQSDHFLRHDTIVMVSGGSGITPFISIIRELIFRSKISQCNTPNMILIPIFKSSMDLTMLDLLLPITGSPSELSNLNLQIEAYVTKEKEPAIDNSKRIRSIWFKPLPTDKPMAAILGPNNWLWLSAIISSSTIMFVVLIGIITRFYIYPIDHNSNKFSYTEIALLNILAICFSIATTASAAVFWNKRRYSKEANQVQNMEGWSNKAYNADRELESVPSHTLAEVSNIHYGRRPDLKRMLSECKGQRVGVLVCGPTKLRHDVAAICSSGLADNLHFESISFSW